MKFLLIPVVPAVYLAVVALGYFIKGRFDLDKETNFMWWTWPLMPVWLTIIGLVNLKDVMEAVERGGRNKRRQAQDRSRSFR